MAQQTQLALTIAIITESGTPEAFSFLSASREVSRAEYHLWHGETIHPADQASPWKSQLGKAASAHSSVANEFEVQVRSMECFGRHGNKR